MSPQLQQQLLQLQQQAAAKQQISGAAPQNPAQSLLVQPSAQSQQKAQQQMQQQQMRSQQQPPFPSPQASPVAKPAVSSSPTVPPPKIQPLVGPNAGPNPPPAMPTLKFSMTNKAAIAAATSTNSATANATSGQTLQRPMQPLQQAQSFRPAQPVQSSPPMQPAPTSFQPQVSTQLQVQPDKQQELQQPSLFLLQQHIQPPQPGASGGVVAQSAGAPAAPRPPVPSGPQTMRQHTILHQQQHMLLQQQHAQQVTEQLLASLTPQQVEVKDMLVQQHGPGIWHYIEQQYARPLPERVRSLSKKCGVISLKTAKMCTKSLKCPQHDDWSRYYFRILILGEQEAKQFHPDELARNKGLVGGSGTGSSEAPDDNDS
jgi:hypothetical protein